MFKAGTRPRVWGKSRPAPGPISDTGARSSGVGSYCLYKLLAINRARWPPTKQHAFQNLCLLLSGLAVCSSLCYTKWRSAGLGLLFVSRHCRSFIDQSGKASSSMAYSPLTKSSKCIGPFLHMPALTMSFISHLSGRRHQSQPHSSYPSGFQSVAANSPPAVPTRTIRNEDGSSRGDSIRLSPARPIGKSWLRGPTLVAIVTPGWHRCARFPELEDQQFG